MERLSTMFSVLFVTWLLLLDQQLVLKTVGSGLTYYDGETFEEATIKAITMLGRITNFVDSNKNDVHMEYTIPTNLNDKKEIDKSKLPSDDVIELDVGGQRIKTLRSTLTVVPNSKLALMFTKDNKINTKSETKQNTPHFFDYNYIQFAYLLDQLRAIKHMREKSAYEFKLIPPTSDVHVDFSYMLIELGLNRADHFLSPLVGAHTNLKIDSLVGWKECYRGNYNVPFNDSILWDSCKGQRLLVACRSISDQNTLTVAGVGKREDIFHSCPANGFCLPEIKNGTGFYHVKDQAWGFQGRPQDSDSTVIIHDYQYLRDTPQGSFDLTPCDSSDQHAEYRLCWLLRSNTGRGVGDRCGRSKNLHNKKEWERLIYQAV